MYVPTRNSVVSFLQEAKEMVNEILRERDHVGFSERNEYGSRIGGGGGGIDVRIFFL